MTGAGTTDGSRSPGSEARAARRSKRQARALLRGHVIFGIVLTHAVLGLWAYCRLFASHLGLLQLNLFEKGIDGLVVLIPTSILTGIAGVHVMRSRSMEGVHRDLVILGWSATVVNLSIPVAICFV